VKIILLGSVNPLDFDLSQEDFNRVDGLKFGRSVPVSDLAISLAELGHKVTVIGIASIAENELSVTTQNGVTLIFIRGRGREKLKAITFYSFERKSMLSQIASLGADVVHAHWTYEYALTAQDSALPHVITVHDEPWEILKGFRNIYFFLRLLNSIRVRLRRSENLVFVSEYLRTLWIKRMFTTGGSVIPNMNRLAKSNSKESQRSNNIVTVGNTDRRKNIRCLLAAWEIAILANPNLQLHLVGPGLGKGDPLAQEFENKFEVHQVIWHGSITRHELSEIYSTCNVLVHPSQWESFGLIYLEAFAFDLGVITLAKSGSTAEVIGDAGLILGDDSPKSLSDAILNLTSNQTLLDQLTVNGRARLKQYSPNQVTRSYISLYERIMGAPK
jgi:glycosyltransferase involved in cell wall biosynthesis